MSPTMPQRLWAELLGTFWLVFGGCGSAVLAATAVTDSNFPVGIGWAGVSLAFGLTVLTGAYALGVPARPGGGRTDRGSHLLSPHRRQG